MVRTVADAERVVALLGKVPVSVHHAWDTEVSHIDVKTQGPVGNGRVICASFYCGPEYDFGAGPRVWVDNLGEAEGVLNVFADFLKDPTKKKAFHNVSFDRHVLYNHGIDVLGLSADTMHMARMWTTSRSKAGGYGLESLSADLLGHRKVPMKERFAVPKLKKDGTPGEPLAGGARRHPLTAQLVARPMALAAVAPAAMGARAASTRCQGVHRPPPRHARPVCLLRLCFAPPQARTRSSRPWTRSS